MNNKLSDLNNHLFAQIERLGDEDLTGEEFEKEITRAKAITGISTQIIANGSLALRAEQFKADMIPDGETKVPKFLEGE